MISIVLAVLRQYFLGAVFNIMDLQKIKLLSCAFVGFTFFNMSTVHASEQYPSRTAGFEYTRGHSPYDTSYQYEKGTLAYSLNELYNILKSRALIHSDK